MSLLRRFFERHEDPDLVARPEFDRHIADEQQERAKVAKRLRAIEVDMENLARVKRLPGQGG